MGAVSGRCLELSRQGATLHQVTLELPTDEIALQTWMVMQQGGLVIPVQNLPFEAKLDVELAFGFCAHRYLLQGTVVATTPHGTALQLAPIPAEARAFFTALEQGTELPALSAAPISPRAARLSGKLTGDIWSTIDEFSEVMLGADPDEDPGTSPDLAEDLGPGTGLDEELERSGEESASVVCEIHDTSSLELPPELVASLEASLPRAAVSDETEVVRRSGAVGPSLEQSAEFSEFSESQEASATIGQLTGQEDVFETLAHTLLGLDPAEQDDERAGDLDAEIEAMLDEVGREDTFTDLAEPSVDEGVEWSAVPWSRQASRAGRIDQQGIEELVRGLAGSRSTGVLCLDLPDRTIYSLWLGGSPTYVTADPPEEGGELEHALASFPLVEPTVFELALKKSAEQDRHLALVLVDVGILQAEDVRDLMRLMARRAVRMFPMLSRGRYQFWECGVPMTDEGLELDLEQVLAWEPGVAPPSEDSLI